jgi:hypothetical protein
VYVITGLLFLLLPGTFLGVWNLISISSRHGLNSLSAAWLQAHGHAQIFGWIGTFIIGIGYYSLSKMGGVQPYAAGRGWVSWILWSTGITMRWAAHVTELQWRILLPLSAAFQLVAFVLFFATVSRHRPVAASLPVRRIETWLKLVMASSATFLLTLIANQWATAVTALSAPGPEIPQWLNQRYLFPAVWGFPVLAVWGFNARWLPVFLGLPDPSSGCLIAALAASVAGLISALCGQPLPATVLLLAASVLAAWSLRVFRKSIKPAKTLGVSRWFPFFTRAAYVWLLVAAVLGIHAAYADVHGGIWGASRHALTVGFLAAMVFAIGQRVLPAFCGMRVLYSAKLMSVSLVLLNLGCLVRVAAEIPAYESNLASAWALLPVSAVTELTAVFLFALNLGITLVLPPPVRAITVHTA